MVDWGKLGKKALDLSLKAGEKGFEQVKKRHENKKELKNNHFESENFVYNSQSGKWKWKKGISLDVADLLSYEFIENGESIAKGGVSLGRALAGSVLLGGAGMLLGGLSGDKKHKEKIKNVSIVITYTVKGKIKTETINYLPMAVDRSHPFYQQAIEKAKSDLALLDMINDH